MTFGEVVVAPMVCRTRPLPISTRQMVSFGVARSIAAASWHPSAVKCHNSTNSFFSNHFRTWRAGLMLRKLGVGRLNWSDGSGSFGGSTSGVALTPGSVSLGA